jgi:hypothetical protein
MYGNIFLNIDDIKIKHCKDRRDFAKYNKEDYLQLKGE